MKETGIIMSGNHPKLILDGVKTQTRRVIKPQPYPHKMQARSVFNISPFFQGWLWNPKKNDLPISPGYNFIDWKIYCPYGQVGDRLWVRETFFYEWPTEEQPDDMRECRIVYRASEPDYIQPEWKENNEFPRQYTWTPSIFMPRWASRITLEITEVRVERLQEISPFDCGEEGINRTGDILVAGKFMKECFQILWDSLNAKRGYGWEVNPWVWVISFRRVDG